MAHQVLFRPKASAEALESKAWYNSREPGLGNQFIEDLGSTVSRIVERPAMFPRVHSEIRRAVLRRFPYAIYFREKAETIVVLAVHGRQNPKRWQSRT